MRHQNEISGAGRVVAVTLVVGWMGACAWGAHQVSRYLGQSDPVDCTLEVDQERCLEEHRGEVILFTPTPTPEPRCLNKDGRACI